MLAALWYHWVLAFLFAFMGVILMGVILLQRGRGVGLAGAFGGAGGNTAFGAKTGDFLTWATICVALLFLVYTTILSHVFVPTNTQLRGATVAPLGESGAGAPEQGQPVALQPSEPPPGFVPPQPGNQQPAAPVPAAPGGSPAAPPAEKPAQPATGGGG